MLVSLEKAKLQSEYSSYTSEKLKSEILETVTKLRGFHDPGLTGFKHYQHAENKDVNVRHFKAVLLEEEDVYDKHILMLLKDFCYIAIALLISLEKSHKQNIFSGKISPKDFLFNKRRKKCVSYDRDTNLAFKKQLNLEQQNHGDLTSFAVELYQINATKYLAPELQDSMRVYNLQKKLKNMIFAAEERGVALGQNKELKELLSDFHLKRAKYTNKCEIYSAGYTLNEILSHSLEKLAKLKLSIHELPEGPVDDKLVKEADALLPDKFENHGTERIIDLLNEVVSYIHDLMREHVDGRDSIPESIAKFKSVLARIKAKAPTGSVLEREEEESEEHDELLDDNWFEEYEPHEEHAHAADGDHQHEEHQEHASHDEHIVHHEEHEQHETHEEHEQHIAHEEHIHEEHDQHAAGDHEKHDVHEEHKHEDHDKHEAHVEHKHDEHAAHEEHDHEEHAAHEDHSAHDSHDDHDDHTSHYSHDTHEDHSASHSDHGGAHSDSAHQDEQHAALKDSPGSTGPGHH